MNSLQTQSTSAQSAKQRNEFHLRRCKPWVSACAHKKIRKIFLSGPHYKQKLVLLQSVKEKCVRAIEFSRARLKKNLLELCQAGAHSAGLHARTGLATAREDKRRANDQVTRPAILKPNWPSESHSTD
jgi:hypothetical protein